MDTAAATATHANDSRFKTIMKDLTDRYTYRVSYSEEDQEFVGLCAEFPSLSWLDKDRTKALDGIVRAVRDVFQDMKTTGEEPPTPLTAGE